jgi:hypothetical protein
LNKHLVVLAASIISLAAGSAQAQGSCTPGNCRIIVTVNDCQRPGGITVNQELVVVDSARNMRWEIVTEGYVFPANGIQFSPPHAQFEPRNSPRPNEVHIFNRKTQTGDFYYYINVTDSNGNACTQVDPTVRNN